jgi:hypothetical protein
MLGPSAQGPRLGDGLTMLATTTTALLTVAICNSRHVKMVPVACLANILSLAAAHLLARAITSLPQAPASFP